MLKKWFATDLDKVAPSDDGMMTAISTTSGILCVYLSRLPMLACGFQGRIAVLAALTEIAVYNEGEIVIFSSFYSDHKDNKGYKEFDWLKNTLVAN